MLFVDVLLVTKVMALPPNFRLNEIINWIFADFSLVAKKLKFRSIDFFFRVENWPKSRIDQIDENFSQLLRFVGQKNCHCNNKFTHSNPF
jgi:hypothetical protein